jgi:hypothetical protein
MHWKKLQKDKFKIMSLQDQINYDIQLAMKARNSVKLAALRAVKSSIMLEATKEGIASVEDDVSLRIITKLVKQRKDSAAIFIEQNRKDLADDEISQLKYLEVYLPVLMNEHAVRKVVKEVILHVEASSKADIGKCMGLLMDRLKGRADASLISSLVKEELKF